MLLRHVEYQARTRGIASLFVLTTQTAHWFVERGFSEAQISHLPLTRQRLYNYQRRSKVFVKAL
jgi:amino-acid N-acetyltransferase